MPQKKQLFQYIENACCISCFICWHPIHGICFSGNSFLNSFWTANIFLTTIACIHICPTRVDSFAVEKTKIRASRLIERRSPKRDCDAFLLCHSKNKPPALQVEGISSDKSNSCAKLDVGLQTTNKKHRRSKMDNNSLAHTKWDCKYHLVFAPKYRRQVIYKDIKADVGQILGTLCRRKGIEIIEAQCMPDHIHMLVSIPPKYSVSEVVGYLKGKSSLMIFEKHANLKYKYGNRHFWCRGYYVDTVGKNTAAIKAYIQNQIKEDLE